MKHLTSYSIKISALLLLLAALASCKKSFLEVLPKGRLINQKIADYNLSLNSLNYVNLTSDAQIVMGDEVSAQESYFKAAPLRTQRLFRYEDVIYEPTEIANEMSIPMQNVYAYNMIINEVMDAVDGSEQEKKSIRAEALVGRAWTYFLLINYYGKPYKESTAADDPGFPFISEADVTNNSYARASVKTIYDSIVKDLTTAMPDMPAQTTHRLRASRAAGEAILGKVYMFMGRFADALPLLSAAITDASNAPIPVRLYDYNVAFGTGGVLLPIGAFGPTSFTAPANEESIYSKQVMNNWAFTNNEIIISPQTVDLYSPSDLRLNFYKNIPYPGGAVYPKKMLRKTAPSAMIGAMMPELYLLRAECKARLNDLPGAKADVEFLRIRRMPAIDAPVPGAIASQQLPLLRFILDERIRELAVAGFRWFDMRRLSVDPLFPGLTFSHSVYNAAGDIVATYTVKPERLTLRLPPKLMEQNPGMENNP